MTWQGGGGEPCRDLESERGGCGCSTAHSVLTGDYVSPAFLPRDWGCTLESLRSFTGALSAGTSAVVVNPGSAAAAAGAADAGAVDGGALPAARQRRHFHPPPADARPGGGAGGAGEPPSALARHDSYDMSATCPASHV